MEIMRCFTHEAMQDATLEPWMAHQPSVAKLEQPMLNLASVAITRSPKADWAQIVDRLLSDEWHRIAVLEQQRSVEACRYLLASIDERVALLKGKLEKNKARLLTNMLKMEHVMSRFDTACALPISPRHQVR